MLLGRLGERRHESPQPVRRIHHGETVVPPECYVNEETTRPPPSPARPESYVREIMRPFRPDGYPVKMPKAAKGAITQAHIDRVARFIRAQINEDRTEDFHVKRSGIPQSTFNAARRGVKLGWSTALRLAEYFGWGSDVAGFLDGTTPAGHYSSLEEVMPVGYPARGVVLDRFRGIVASDLLDEVQQIVLPPSSPDWTELDWAKAVLGRVSDWERLGKDVHPTNVVPSSVGGQDPKHRKPT